MTYQKTHEIVKLYNVGCEHCAKVCDKALGKKHYAYAEFKKGTLYVDMKDSAAIIPALHLLEYFVSNGHKIDKVIIPKFNGDLESLSEDTAVCETHDISEWKRPNKKSYLVINRRDGVYAEDLLNTYNDVLMQSYARGIPIAFPRDVILKGASKAQMDDLTDAIELRSIHYAEQPGLDFGLIEEEVAGQSVMNRISELPPVHITESINMYTDVLHLLNKEYAGRSLTENGFEASKGTNIFRTLNRIDAGRPFERKMTKKQGLSTSNLVKNK